MREVAKPYVSAMPRLRERKPAWSRVPLEVRREAERRLRSRVARATIAYGGYAPSATFRLVLANGRRAFFKASYPLPQGSVVQLPVDEEEKRYLALAPFTGRFTPRIYATFRLAGWHVLLMEDLGPPTMPPWTAANTRLAARSYARFHRRTLGAALPRWLSRSQHRHFGAYWARLAKSDGLARTAALAGRRSDEAREWLDVTLPVFVERERWLVTAPRPFVLLHFDTRSDNVRLVGDRMVMFDWPFASVGPAEFDAAAFAQAVAAERGPLPERVIAHYEELLPLRERQLDGSIAGIAGYFAARAGLPEVPELPRLRSVQRRQLKATVAWAARRFDLPDPRWLGAVKD